MLKMTEILVKRAVKPLDPPITYLECDVAKHEPFSLEPERRTFAVDCNLSKFIYTFAF